MRAGSRVMPGRLRSAGVLDADEVRYCRENGIALAYDPVQIGWVPLDVDDDLVVHAHGLSEQPDALGDRLLLRPWEADDLDAYERILRSPRLWRYMTEPQPDPFTREVAAQLLEISRTGDHHEVRAVELDDEIVGQVRLWFGATSERRVAEISYWLAEEQWGKGIMSAVLARYTAESFRRHPLVEIHAWIHPENVGSARAAERAGYRRDDTPDDGGSIDGSASRHAGFARWVARRRDRT